jgi:hypothetical protein
MAPRGGPFQVTVVDPVPAASHHCAGWPRQPANLNPMGKPEKLAAGVRIFDGFELMFHGHTSRNARRTGFADTAYPALEYDR